MVTEPGRDATLAEWLTYRGLPETLTLTELIEQERVQAMLAGVFEGIAATIAERGTGHRDLSAMRRHLGRTVTVLMGVDKGVEVLRIGVLMEISEDGDFALRGPDDIITYGWPCLEVRAVEPGAAGADLCVLLAGAGRRVRRRRAAHDVPPAGADVIYQVVGGLVISSHGVWLPGVYADARAARYAFRLPDVVLERVNADRAAAGRDVTTFAELRTARQQYA